MKNIAVWAFYALIFAWGSAPAFAYDEFVNYLMGENQVTAWVYDNGPGYTYFAPHDDENTAVAAAMEAVAAHGGRVVQITHTGRRNISFVYAQKTYSFDPNRMFSDDGIRTTLTKEGGNYSQEAHNMVRAFAQDVLKLLGGEGWPIVAVHNNTPGSYSAESYRPGGVLAREASRVHLSPAWSPDDFFFVTVPRDYEFFQSRNCNVVLQSPLPSDDGSLSVYAVKKGIRYINIEAQEGHSAEQARMIRLLYGS